MRPILFAVSTFVVFSGCQLEKLAPHKVAMGVGRLTARNTGTLTALLEATTECGFSSDAVKAAAVVEGAVGEVGTVTWKVEGCALDFGQGTVVAKDCVGNETEVGGRATLTGTKVIRGQITGNAASPVIPLTPDAVQMDVRAELNGFFVRTVGKSQALTIKEGAVAWTAQPHLAQSVSKGLCMISTNDLSLSGITYEFAKGIVNSGDGEFDVEITASSFGAQVGQWGDRENAIEGQLSVWDSSQKLPIDGDTDGLDPEYDRATFLETFACKADLAQPVSYDCRPLEEVIAQGASQLTVSSFGNIVSLIDDNTTCGFANQKVLEAAELTGELGRRDGSATLRITEPCYLTFATKTPVKTDCNGVELYMQGKVAVTGVKTVRGIRTGDVMQPIIPTTRDPGEATATIVFEDFTVSDSLGRTALTVKGGSLSGTVKTRVALDTRNGACSIKTPVAEFVGLQWSNANVVVNSDGNLLPLAISHSLLEAQNGQKGDRTNYLAGTLMAAGKAFTIPTAGEPVLNPSYDAAVFGASYACLPGLHVPASEAECSFHRVQAEGAARLLVLNAGTIASMTNANSSCGFEATGVKLSPDVVVGSSGEQGLMEWSIESCDIGDSSPVKLSTDCLGGSKHAIGTARVDATRTVTGIREKILLFVDSIVPNDPQSVTIRLDAAHVTEFAAWTLAPGATEPQGTLTLHSGLVRGTVKPILAERESEPGTFDVQTPVARLNDIVLVDGDATLRSGTKTFRFTIGNARLSAAAGSFMGLGNLVSGTVEVDGVPVEVGPMPLDPSFKQGTFDESYACTDDLKALVTP